MTIEASDEQLEVIMRDAMIEGLLEKDVDFYEALSTEALLDVFKYKVCGLKKVDGRWVNPEGDDDASN